MVLDLIRSISSEENFVAILDKNKEFGASSSSQGRSARRLALRNNDRIMQVHMDMQQLRSFLSFECDVNKHWVMLSSFNFVRVLDIHTSRGRGEMKRHHLEHLRNLLHLRYLRLRAATMWQKSNLKLRKVDHNHCGENHKADHNKNQP